MNYHTIFFDVGGTLLSAYPSIGAVYAEVAGDYGIEADADEVEQAVRRWFAERRAEDLRTGAMPTTSIEKTRAWWREGVRRGLNHGARSPRFEAFFGAVFEEFAHATRYRLYPEVEGVLEKLRARGRRLGIISNWDERLRSVLDGMDLTRRFETVIISGEAGVEKPDRRIYDLARERCGACGDDPLLQIGDNPIDDGEGARAAGFEARILDRRQSRTLDALLDDLLA